MRLPLITLAACAALSWSLPAAAQTQPSAQDIQQAQDRFNEGARRYVEKDYAGALIDFLAAQTLSPNAMFLYNISLTRFRLGELEKSIETGEAAEAMGGMGETEFAQNQGRMTALRRVIFVRDGSWTPPETANAVEQTVASTKPDDTTVKVGDPEPLPDESQWPMRIVLTAGVLSGGLLVGWALTERSLADDFADYEAAAAAGDKAEYDRLGTEIDDGQSLAKILLYSGVGLGIVAAGVLLMDMSTGSDDMVLTPTANGWALAF